MEVRTNFRIPVQNELKHKYQAVLQEAFLKGDAGRGYEGREGETLVHRRNLSAHESLIYAIYRGLAGTKGILTDP